MAGDISFNLLLSNHHTKTYLFAVRLKAICMYIYIYIYIFIYIYICFYDHYSTLCYNMTKVSVSIIPWDWIWVNREIKALTLHRDPCGSNTRILQESYVNDMAADVIITSVTRSSAATISTVIMQNKAVFYNRKSFNYMYQYIIGKC